MLRLPVADDPTTALMRGLAVFPIPPGDRYPRAKGWQHTATQTPWDWQHGDNIGVGCRASNVVVLDLDVDDPCRGNGIEHLNRLCAARRQPRPLTFTVRTPSGGLHMYFAAPSGCTIGSVSGWPSGIDVRGPGRRLGGYVIGPGSVVGGVRYEVQLDVPISLLPAWLSDLLTRDVGTRPKAKR